jgi:hypothetical protein
LFAVFVVVGIGGGVDDTVVICGCSIGSVVGGLRVVLGDGGLVLVLEWGYWRCRCRQCNYAIKSLGVREVARRTTVDCCYCTI